MRKIFFSWQTDSPLETNKDLIHDALVEAAKGLERAAEVDDATREIPGTPAIFEAVSSKISECAVFVADLTLVPMKEEGRYTCNPNVLIEYGYALAKRGDKLLLPVMNTSFGLPDQLPFDLRHRAVRVVYELAEEATSAEIEKVKHGLVDQLCFELRLILENPASALRMSDVELQVAAYLLGVSKEGAGYAESEIDEIAAATGLGDDEIRQASAELLSRDYVEREEYLGTDSPPIRPTPQLFWDLDPFILGSDPRSDAKQIAGALVESSQSGYGQLSTRAFMEKKGWPPRRLNPALLYLIKKAIVREINEISPDVVTSEILETDRTRAFLRGDFDPETLRPALWG